MSVSVTNALPGVLIVDDEPSVRSAIRDFLSGEGYDVLEAQDKASMQRVLAENDIGIVLLDVMLSGENGLSLARDLRERDDIGVIMISALGTEADRIVGLEMGADDYLPKPVSPRELLARIRALQRRYPASRSSRQPHYEFAGWHLDPVRRILRNASGVLTSLSQAEFAILLAFVRNPDRPIQHEDLASLVDGASGESDVDVQVARIRRKLGSAGSEEFITKSPEGSYAFVAPVRALPADAPAEVPSPKKGGQARSILFDASACEARIDGRPLDLTFSEFTLLAMLYEARNSAVSKDALSRHVLGRPWQSFDRSIDVHVSNLRNKLADQSAIMIETIRKVGYKLRMD